MPKKTNRSRMFLIGAGGHAVVAIATLQAAGWTIDGLYDDDPRLWKRRVLDIPVKGPIELLRERRGRALLAIGDNAARARLATTLAHLEWISAVHPRAWVHTSVRLGEGTLVMAGAVIQPGASIGRHVILNTSASVDHDSRVGDFAHLAPGVHLAGNVEVREGVMMGIGAVALPGISIGAWTVVGAGSVVRADVPARRVAYGVPARVHRKTKS